MPVSYNSAARNLFLLGSSGQQVAQNFFKYIDKENSVGDGYISTSQIRYFYNDDKYIISGSGRDLNLVGYGFFDKRNYDQETDPANPTTTLDYETRILSTNPNPSLGFVELLDLHVDSNGDLIVCGHVDGTSPWIAKYSYAAGVLVWQSSTFTGNIHYTNVTSDATGYYACGKSIVTGECVVEKYDLNGNPVWGKKISTVGGSSNKIILESIHANSRGQVIAVGNIEDLDQTKGYMIKITSNGDYVWDKSLQADKEESSWNYKTRLTDIHIDDKDQLFVSGNLHVASGGGRNGDRLGWIGKFSAEGNLIWQKQTTNGSGTHMNHRRISADNQTEQVTTVSEWSSLTDEGIALSKYSKNGTLLWRRSLISDSSSFIDNPVLDADSSFYYISFIDEDFVTLSNTPYGYVFGKVSTSGNGLGEFDYPDGSGSIDTYKVLNITDEIARLDDGSVRFDSSDLRKTPFSANHIIFDDYSTQVSKKKINAFDAGVMQYSGSPAIRPADFLTKEYDTDEYGVPPQKNYIGLSESLSPASTNSNPSPNNTWTRQTTNVTVTANDIANPLGVGTRGEKYNISATTGRRLEYGVPSGVFVSGQQYTYSWWMKAITTDAQWNFQAYQASSSNNSIRIADKDGNILENISTTNTTGYKPKDTEWHRVVWTFTANNTTGSAVGGYNNNGETGDLWYLWGAQLVDGSDPGKYYRNYTGTPENAAGTEHAPDIVDGYYNFDQSEILQIGEIPGDFSEMTVEIWFKSDTFSNWQNPIDCNYHVNDASGTTQSGNIGPRLEINASGQIGWYWGSSLTANDPKSSSIITNISTNTWYHSVLTISGPQKADGEFFLNGSSVGVNTSSGGGSWYGEIRNLILGRGFVLGGRYFDGQVGEVRIYPRALTPAQVYQNYNATKSKYINEAPDTAPKIGPGIVYDSNLLLNYDFGNRATYDRATNLIAESILNPNSGLTSPDFWQPQEFSSPTQVTDPFGSNNAYQYLSVGGNVRSRLLSAGSLNPTQVDSVVGEQYTFSIFVKPINYDIVQFGTSSAPFGGDPNQGGSGNTRVVFNLSTGTTNAANQPSVSSASIIPYGDGWLRLVATTIPATVATGIRLYVDLDSAGAQQHTTSEGYQLFGAQIETGTTVGRPIRTYGSAITAPTTVKNLSSSSYPGTINGAEFDTDGYFEFDGPPGLGAGDYINIGTTSTFNWIHNRTESGWAIEGWFWNDRDEEYGALISNNSGTGAVGFYMGQRNDSQFECVINKGTTGTQACRVLSTNVLDHNRWYHIVFVNDNYTIKLYIDGVLQSNGGDQNSFATGSTADAQTDLRIAKLADSPAWNLDGKIGEVRIYQTSLSATEVSQNFNATKSKYGL